MNLEISKLLSGKKIYFASDFHLGVPTPEDSLSREKKIVAWLESIRCDAQQVFLVGDLFDFWFEYKHVAPKGFVRFLGKLAELTDQGIELVVFCGNHDLWFDDYLTKEIGATIIRNPISFVSNRKKFYIAHGDGLGPGDLKFRIIKSVFTNKVCQWLFGWVHPTIGFGLAHFWSSKSKEALPTPSEDKKLIAHSIEIEKTDHHDFYIYGDCHLAKEEKITNDSSYFNLGDWITHFSYAEFDGDNLDLKVFEK